MNLGNFQMLRPLLIACSAFFAAFSAPLFAQGTQELEVQDLRLARIADEMLVANLRLCRATMPVTGMILHSRDQYPSDQPQSGFANGDLAIAAIVAGSVADEAGLVPDDAILAIGDTGVTSLQTTGSQHLREVAFDLLAQSAGQGALQITIARGEEQLIVPLATHEGCRALVEVRIGDTPRARTDGRIIQITYDYMQELSDEGVAVTLAHELAHVILEHRRRKTDVGIDNSSIFRSLGRNREINRVAEIEADRLAIHVLANAGYDPSLAEQFWRDRADGSGGAITSFVYPSRSARADLAAREIRLFLPLRRGPSWPGHLVDLRDRSFADY